MSDGAKTLRLSGAWRGLVLPLVLAVLLVALVVTTVGLTRDRGRDRGRDLAPEPVGLVAPADVAARGAVTPDGAAREAVVRAREAATTYFTLGFRTVEADMDTMRALGTEDFVTGYDAAAPTLAKRVTGRKVTLSAALPRDGVATEYLTAEVAQVLVAVDVTTTRSGSSRTAPYSTRITLERVDGTWLVAALDEVG